MMLEIASEYREKQRMPYGKSLYFAAVAVEKYRSDIFGDKRDPYNKPENSYRFIKALFGNYIAKKYLKTDEAWRLSSKYENFK